MKKQSEPTIIEIEDFESQIESADFDQKSAIQSHTDKEAVDEGSVDIQFVDTDVEYSHSNQHTKRKKRRPKKYLTKKQKFLRKLITIAIVLFSILLVLFIALFILRLRGQYSLLGYKDIELSAPDSMADDVSLLDDGKTVIYKGKTYHFNPDVTNILFMGIDQPELGANSYGTAGQADAVFLFAYDTKKGTSTLISVPRDSMVDIDIYSSGGKYVGIKNQQLCLAFAYGDGGEASCQNVITSVSRLFYGIPINSYFAVDMSAIIPLNDSVGGVTVTVLEDIPGMTKGQEVTLQGADAITYVRYRDESVLESSVLRLERQKQYLNAFAEKLIPAIKSDISVALDLYNTALEYTVTNINTSRVTYLATTFSNSDVDELEITSVEGEVIRGEYYAEFYPVDVSFYELILDTFYTVEEK